MTKNPESLLQEDELENVEEEIQDEIVQENEQHEEHEAYESEDDEYTRIQAANKKGLSVIDALLNKLWSRRFWAGVGINACLVGSALYNGKIFVICVVLTAIFHIVDKHTDYKIHIMHQKREYVKYGY